MPNIDIIKKSSNTLRMAEELIEIYPELKDKNISPSRLLESNYIEIFKMKLLYDNKLDHFQRIVGSEKIIKSCHLMIDNKLINFTKIDLGVANYFGLLYLFNRLNYSLIDEKKIESITITLFDFDVLTVDLVIYNVNHVQQYIFDLDKHFRTKVTFSTFSIQKLNSFEQNCINEQNVKDFDGDYTEFCLKDCYFRETNETYGCFPMGQTHVYFERDIKKNGHKFCNNSYNVDSALKVIDKKCETKCIPKCTFINFNVKLGATKHILNETILEFIPKKCARIAYIETLKTDLNRLIYNCGGIFGLWFGLTPFKAVDLIEYAVKIFGIFSVKIMKIVLYLALFKRWIICIITIFLRFVCKLFAYLSLFYHNLKALCIRCIRNSIAYFISIVYKLIAVFKSYIN
jgi:hypothetical protein